MIGRMRHRVAIQNPVRTSDSGGGAAVSYLTTAEVWADVEPLASTGPVSADRREYRPRFDVTIRFRSGVDFRTRIVHDGRALTINSIRSENERGKFLVLRCEERAA
ncbi:MAG: phage head closure protein [Pseudomonadota bacterium]